MSKIGSVKQLTSQKKKSCENKAIANSSFSLMLRNKHGRSLEYYDDRLLSENDKNMLNKSFDVQDKICSERKIFGERYEQMSDKYRLACELDRQFGGCFIKKIAFGVSAYSKTKVETNVVTREQAALNRRKNGVKLVHKKIKIGDLEIDL